MKAIKWNEKNATFGLPMLLILAVSLAGCNKDMDDLQQYVNTVKARPPQPIEPIPVIKPYVRFIYPGHAIDQFDVSILEPDEPTQPTENSVMIDSNRVPEFLESFPLDSLRMVGTVFKENELWALIRIPSGAVHRVKKGNYIGKNHGKILEVGDVSLSLNEIVENGFGGYKERENELTISNPQKNI
ncbi:MAG: pilus assembly protein PilP [Thiolinea sp.]